MRVIQIEGGAGPAEALKIAERPDPVAGPGQVVIRVRAAGVNRPDLLQRTGAYPPPPGASDILGLEVHAGHGLTFDTVGRIAALPELAELNIGHFLIAESIFTGLSPAIAEMRRRMEMARR